MGKAKNDTIEKVINHRLICILCQKVIRNSENLCVHCKNRVLKKHDPEAHNFDKILIQLMLNTKANLRPKLVKKLQQSLNQGIEAQSD